MLRTPQFYLIFLTFVASAGVGLMATGLMKQAPMDALMTGSAPTEAQAKVQLRKPLNLERPGVVAPGLSRDCARRRASESHGSGSNPGAEPSPPAQTPPSVPSPCAAMHSGD